jgi:hypothetical protein
MDLVKRVYIQTHQQGELYFFFSIRKKRLEQETLKRGLFNTVNISCYNTEISHTTKSTMTAVSIMPASSGLVNQNSH